MDDKQLYQQLLGITTPWRVERVELDVDQQEVAVHVDCRACGAALVCPDCQRPCPYHDAREERRWRHLDSCGFSTYLVARMPRVRCEEHGVKTIEVPWSKPHSRFTLAFECFAITVLRSTGVQSKAAGLLRLSSAQVHELMAQAVERGLARRRRVEAVQVVKHVSLDEKSFKKGHHYISVLGDSRECRVLEVVEGRTVAAAKQALEQGLSAFQREQVESVTMDMWAPYLRAGHETVPAADIVHDRFHVAKYLGQAVDQTRRAEQRQFAAQRADSQRADSQRADSQRADSQRADSPLHGTKYLWLTRPENLSPDKRALLDAVREHNLETGKVWMFKESFRAFFALESVTEAATFFLNWREAARELGNKFLSAVVGLLEKHQRGLLNYHFYRTSNATAEGLNSQIQQIKANARGFRRFGNFRIAILFFLGKLELYPQTFS